MVSTQDLDLSAYATVNDLIAGLNAISGVSASITDGKLVIAASDSSNGVALGDIDASVGGQGFSDYFGFNDIFSGRLGQRASRCPAGWPPNSSVLPTAALDVSGTLAVGWPSPSPRAASATADKISAALSAEGLVRRRAWASWRRASPAC
ncbi:hypothetical protein ACRAWD_22595 [Caulobacter segnis]